MELFENLMPMIAHGKKAPNLPPARKRSRTSNTDSSAPSKQPKEPGPPKEIRHKVDDEEHMRRLIEFVELCGADASLVDGW